MDSMLDLDYHDAVHIRYGYQPIDTSEIRCIVLDTKRVPHTGSILSKIRESGGYSALSYAWGTSAPDPDRKCFVETDDKLVGHLPLTENLDHALRDLKHSTLASEPFFIDQISINQYDNEEKSVHITNMGEVYTYADQVVTYLGPEQHGDAAALDLLERIVNHVGSWYEEVVENDGVTLELLDQINRQGLKPTTIFEVAESEISSYRHLEKLIYDNGWTQRLWMCQENLLPKTLYFMRGSRLIERRSIYMLPFVQTLELVRPWPRILPPNVLTMRRTYEDIHLRDLTKSFFLLVDSFGVALECSDPKDKIYALLGLARDTWDIVPDYDADNLDVFVDFAVRSIDSTRTYRIFEYISQNDKTLFIPTIPTSKGEWPSWVPSFEFQSNFGNDNLATGSTLPKATLLPETNQLSVQGIQVDCIEEVIGAFDDSTFPLNTIESFDSLRRTLTILEATLQSLTNRGVKLAAEILCYTLKGSPEPLVLDDSSASPAVNAARAVELLLEILKKASDSEDLDSCFGSEHLDADNKSVFDSFIVHLGSLNGSSLCISAKGHPVTATSGVRPGDVVVMLPGGAEAYVLRKRVSTQYIFLGPAYLHPYMSGQVLLDSQWVEDLRGLVLKILNGDSYDSELGMGSEDTQTKLEFQQELQSDINYLIGALYISRRTYIFERGTTEGEEAINEGVGTFVSSNPAQQAEVLHQAVVKGPFDVHVNTLWRRYWWGTIDEMIEKGLIRQPKWMANLQNFVLS